MAKDEFDALLARMPEIAEAVNAFTSESIQQEALQALVASFGGPATSRRGPKGAPGNRPPEKPGTGKKTKRKPSSGKGGYRPKFISDLDLAPKGKKPFREFIDEKQPKDNQERYAVIVYYLQHELSVAPITLDHVATVFRLAPGLKEPKNVRSGVTTAASRRGMIDTKDIKDIKTTPHGRNFVQHDLPPKKAKK